MNKDTVKDDVKLAQELVSKYKETKSQVSNVIVGQDEAIKQILSAIFVGGHTLLIGVPGLAKTLLVNTISKILGLHFNRIQFTPDLMPSDIIGSDILNQNKEFEFIKGPIFCNVLLADEINRTPPKTQSALLEAMEEKSVTISGKTYDLSFPFYVLATQNPIEQEGTYPLPEAQVDRFMLKIKLEYPNKSEEQKIMRQNLLKDYPEPNKVINTDKILEARELIKEIYIDEKIEQYIVDLIFATRNPYPEHKNLISFGASPRASINLAKAAKAIAFMNRRGYVIPEDVRSVALDVLRHRLGLTYEAEAEEINSDQIIQEIINKVQVP